VVTDPLLTAVAIGLLGSVIAGPALSYGLQQLPQRWRRTAEWGLILGAVTAAIVADLLTEGPGGGGAMIYVVAALPGIIAFLAWRSLLASALIALLPLYFVIAIMTRDRLLHVPETALDRAMPIWPAWVLVYGSLYVFMVLLPVLVVRQPELFRRALQG
jgi:hypothetical protein